MHISFDIPTFIFILAGISALLSMIYFTWNALNYRTLYKNIKNSDSLPQFSKNSPCEESHGVSVVVYADNNALTLADNLPQILNQDYPLFEVIVVNDGANEDIHDLLKRLSYSHTNLRYTFTPDDAHCVSRKKLSLMIGIKAAKYDAVITTNAYCFPQTPQWISSIARHFANGADIVLGHSKLADGCDTGCGAYLRSFLTVQNTLKYLIHALRHKPYRGISDNLAFRKELFFKNRGYAQSMNLHYGEDDIFVNEIATHDNTQVEISPESFVTYKHQDPARRFTEIRQEHAFTERKIHSAAFFFASLRSGIYISNICMIVAICALGYHNIIISSSAVFLTLLLTIPTAICYKKTAQLFQERSIGILTPLFTLIHPFANLSYKIKSRRHKSSYYTWQQLKK